MVLADTEEEKDRVAPVRVLGREFTGETRGLGFFVFRAGFVWFWVAGGIVSRGNVHA